MTETILAIFGIASGFFNAVGFIPYIYDILKGNTKPQRATYWIWFMVSIISFFGQLAGGAHWTLVWAFTGVIGTGIVSTLSIKYGFGTFNLWDGLALLIATFGVLLSLTLRSPLVAVLTALLIDIVAASLTLHKTWQAPHTEHLPAWAISFMAATCGLIAVGHWLPAIFLAPLLNFVVNALMISFIIYRKPRLALSIATEAK